MGGLPNYLTTDPGAISHNGGLVWRPRIKHVHLNKDKGDISIDPNDLSILTNENTPVRGLVGDNFERSVQAAIADTRNKWNTFQHLLQEEYGPEKSEKMICALTRDHPVDDC